MKKFPKNLNKGLSTLEILLAFAILILAITAVLQLGFGNQSITVDSETNAEALNKAQELLEQARADAKLDFNLVNPKIGINDDIYKKNLQVEMVDLFTKKVSGNVNWMTDGGRNVEINLTTLITNPKALDGGDTCSSVLAGNWTDPQITEPINVGNTPSGNPVTDIRVFDKTIYITTDNSHGQNNDFYIYSILDDPLNPIISNGPDGIDANGEKSGFNAVAVSKRDSNKYVYLANAHPSNFSTCTQSPNCSQLRIVNVTNPSSPILGATYKLPGVTGTGGQSIGKSIFYKNGYVYLGLSKTLTGPEFNIIDVRVPTAPVRVGSFSVGRGINSIEIKDNLAYLVTDDNSRELIILNISVPASISLVGTYNAQPDSTNFGFGKSLALLGNKLYLGRTYISNAPEFIVLNIANPGAIPQTPLLSKDLGITSNPLSVNGIAIRDYLGFFMLGNSSAGTGYFQIWNLNTMSLVKSFNLSDIVFSGSIGSTSGCEGNYLYLGSYRKSNDKGVILVVYPKTSS